MKPTPSTALVAVLIAIFGCFSTIDSALLPRKLGEVKLQSSAFLQVFSEETTSEEFDPNRFTLLISTFEAYAPFETDAKFYIRGPGKYLKNLTAMSEALTELDRTAYWPNDPDFVESDVFGYEAIAWPSGFLVPGKTEGKMEIYNMRNFSQAPVNIASLDTKDWFYHRTIWMDLNDDGLKDAFTARFRNPTAEDPIRSEFLWFENPGSLQEGWPQRILFENGPDVHFTHLYIENTAQVKYSCILASEFWNKRLVLYCVEDKPGAWANSEFATRVVVDADAGQTFDCLVGDLNNDGKLDLVTTAYNPDIETGYVYAYEVPATFPFGNFVKHTIADDFHANTIIGGDSMSPGSGKLFHRNVAEKGSKASMMLSGDDDGRHYILTPNSEDSADWTYTKSLLVDTNSTTSGKFAVEDLDGDGWTEIIAAGYSTGTLYVFTFAPEE